jgi:hypothetical protein
MSVAPSIIRPTRKADQMLDQLEKVVLAKYNETQNPPVDKYDRFFKAYLIGVMSGMITKEKYNEIIKMWSK